MLTFVREVSTTTPVDEVFDYLADFTTVNDWDPRAHGARRVHGDGAAGTTYQCDVSFARRTVAMRYTVVRLVPDETVEWVGESAWVRAHDVIRIRRRGETTHVQYLTQYRYRHASWLLERVLARAVSRLCDDARDGLQDALDRRARRTPVP